MMLITCILFGDQTEWGWSAALLQQTVITANQLTPRSGIAIQLEQYDIDYEIILTTPGDHIGAFATIGWDQMFYILDIHPYFGYRFLMGYHNGGFQGGGYIETGLLYHLYHLWKPLKVGFTGEIALLYQDQTLYPAFIGGLTIRIDIK